MQNVHGSSVFYKNKGIMFIGPSGSGKSDICLRLIMSKGAMLIADDRTDLYVKNNYIYASCPETIKGLLEIRGIGIKNFDYILDKKIDLVVELVKDIKEIERLPKPAFYEFEGIMIPKIKLYAFESSVLEKLDILLI